MFAASAQFPGKDMLGIAIAGGPLGRPQDEDEGR